MTVVADVAAVAIGAWLGVALRLGLQDFYALAATDEVFPALYAQVAGCAVMAATVRHKPALLGSYAPVVLALGTGFAGSLTTFSSWMSSATLAVLGFGDSAALDGGTRFVTWLTIIVVGLAAAFFGFGVGDWLSDPALWKTMAKEHPAHEQGPPSSSAGSDKPVVAENGQVGLINSHKSHQHMLADFVLVSFALVCLAVTIAIAALYGAVNPYPLSILFAPVGALIRWSVGLWLNTSAFPYGTFATNMIGSIICITLYMIIYNLDLSMVGCNAMLGLSYGFCGALTTVSSYINEIHSLPRRTAVIYMVASIALAQALQLLIAGIVRRLVTLDTLETCM